MDGVLIIWQYGKVGFCGLFSTFYWLEKLRRMLEGKEEEKETVWEGIKFWFSSSFFDKQFSIQAF